MLKPVGPDIWLADGPVVSAAMGFRYPTRMAVIRLAGGDLFVWSPVGLTPALKAETDALGTVRHLIAPNSLHHVFLTDWIAAYPEARVHAPPGLPEKRSDIAFASVLGDSPDPCWAAEIDQVVMHGNAITTEIVFFHKPSGVAIFTDILQQMPTGWYRGWRGLVARLDLMTEPEPTVPRKFRMAFRDRKAARAAVMRVLAWPVRKVVIAHGPTVDSDAAAFLRRAFFWLTK